MRTFPQTTLACLGLAALSWAGTPSTPTESAVTPDPREHWADGNFFFGEWDGQRELLLREGISFDSYYVTNIAGNPTGGRKSGGFTYTDNFYLGMSLDLEKLVGWEDATFAISAVNRDGRSLTEEYVGSQYNSQQVFGGQNLFLYNVTLEQKFWDNKASLKVGRFGASDDFNTSSLYGLYMSNGIDGNIRNVLFDTQFSAYPFATWAARLRLDPTPEWNAQIGVFQTWTDIFDRGHNGLDWNIRSDDGVFLIAQVGWTPVLGTKEIRDEKGGVVHKGLPGHYWFGASYSPWTGYPKFGESELAGDSYGFYAHADQMVYQEHAGTDQGLTLWLATALYPQEEISIIPYQLNVGAIYKGLIPSREKDLTILGVIYGNFSNRYADTIEATGAGRPEHETVIEVGYRIQLTKFAYIQPDLQWIINPGGTGNIPDALVIGAQIGITF